MRVAEKECHKRFGAWDKHDHECRITRRQCLYIGKYWDHARQTCTTPNPGCKWDQERGTCIPYHAHPKYLLEHLDDPLPPEEPIPILHSPQDVSKFGLSKPKLACLRILGYWFDKTNTCVPPSAPPSPFTTTAPWATPTQASVPADSGFD